MHEHRLIIVISREEWPFFRPLSEGALPFVIGRIAEPVEGGHPFMSNTNNEDFDHYEVCAGFVLLMAIYFQTSCSRCCALFRSTIQRWL